ncbi:hypothetical protein DPMN_063774, partial [Dreissena polymorpha]
DLSKISACIEVGLKSTEVHSQPDLRSDSLGYLDNGECFHGYYTEGNDWVKVIDDATELYIGRGSLFPCDPKMFPNEDIHARLRPQCNFDLDSLCSWKNVHGQDDFDWVLYQSSTPTDDTGPDFDHTLRNATGRLDVYQALETSVPGNLMWSVIGDNGNAWLQGQVALESAQNYSIIIAGFVGNGYLGDIAIDDVSLSDGYCDVQPPSASRSDVSNSTLARELHMGMVARGQNATTIICSSGFEIKCGSDGLFYPNLCELAKAKCYDNNLTMVDMSYCGAGK